VLINQSAAAESIAELAENTTLPILQDTTDQATFTRYGADKWYIYIIGPDQYLHLLHYSLDLDDDRARLITEITELRDGRSDAPPRQDSRGTP
jgi:hypothetical protein